MSLFSYFFLFLLITGLWAFMMLFFFPSDLPNILIEMLSVIVLQDFSQNFRCASTCTSRFFPLVVLKLAKYCSFLYTLWSVTSGAVNSCLLCPNPFPGTAFTSTSLPLGKPLLGPASTFTSASQVCSSCQQLRMALALILPGSEQM